MKFEALGRDEVGPYGRLDDYAVAGAVPSQEAWSSWARVYSRPAFCARRRREEARVPRRALRGRRHKLASTKAHRAPPFAQAAGGVRPSCWATKAMRSACSAICLSVARYPWLPFVSTRRSTGLAQPWAACSAAANL